MAFYLLMLYCNIVCLYSVKFENENWILTTSYVVLGWKCYGISSYLSCYLYNIHGTLVHISHNFTFLETSLPMLLQVCSDCCSVYVLHVFLKMCVMVFVYFHVCDVFVGCSLFLLLEIIDLQDSKLSITQIVSIWCW